MPEPTRSQLARLATRYGLVACVTGRESAVAREIVGVPSLVYVGEHGLELAPEAKRWAPRIHAFAAGTGWHWLEDKPLASERVHCVSMPSRYSSAGTRSDARRVAESLGCDFREIPIEPMFEAYSNGLAEHFAGRESDLAEENLQARIRGNLLMALSNKFGWLVLTTGNKSEMSVGYSTLYGDSAGGFAVIKDCPKLLVYRLVRERAARQEPSPVPESIITRAPSAELRPDQRDQDSLPPYEVLDAILEGYVEEDLGREQLIARGLPAADVDRVIRLVDGSEYKRRQNPPGIKVTSKAFGRDRRVPIVNRYGG